MTAMDAATSTVRTIGLAGHPPPHDIADQLEALAKTIRKHATRAIDLAHQLASRGYPAGTLGDGGSRSSDTTSSTERNGNPDLPSYWHGVDGRYAQALHDLHNLTGRANRLTLELVAHADDIDPTPAGTGACRACNRVCRPDAQRPGNRLVAGLCPTCYKAWQRYRRDDGSMQWSSWVAKRRESYSERDTEGRLIAVHTPEPDHTLDLSHELPADHP